MERCGRLEEEGFPWLRVKELKADTQYLCLHSLSSRSLGAPWDSREEEGESRRGVSGASNRAICSPGRACG